MKRGLLAAAMALTTAVGFAQAVTFNNVLAVEPLTDAAVYSAAYVPVSDKFLVSHATTIDIFNGVTGAAEGKLDISGITPGGLGFFAITATEDGYIYSYENSGQDIWRWSSISDMPTKVYDTVSTATGTQQRFGATATTDDGIMIAFTGASDDGPVEFFSDSFPFASGSFTFEGSVDLDAKSSLALGSDGKTLFTVGTPSQRTILKWINVAGVWTQDPVWPAPEANPATAEPIGAGAFAYDDLNDILFVHDMRGTANNSLKAYNGTTGEIIGTATLPVLSGTLAGYASAYVAPTTNGGTLYVAARGRTSSSHASLYKWTYVVDTSSVDDWSLYQQ